VFVPVEGKTRTTATAFDAVSRTINVAVTSDDGAAPPPPVQTEYSPTT
jgi:hypothetical protein